MDNRFSTYKQVNVNTMNRGKIVVMLFSGAITFLNKARIYAEKKDFYKKGKFLNKAQNIIDELNYSLDMDKGNDIAKNLRSIYLFLSRYLNQANSKNDVEMIDKAIGILKNLKDAFSEIVENPDYQDARNVSKKEMTQHAIRKFG
eukprot:Anaeramoba_ignava/a244422_5.p1 GENE.a244422_5~~a244422_5.p1  ORF type:complete len:145 (-),score=7.40 a244422_5:154-588(-)